MCARADNAQKLSGTRRDTSEVALRVQPESNEPPVPRGAKPMGAQQVGKVTSGAAQVKNPQGTLHAYFVKASKGPKTKDVISDILFQFLPASRTMDQVTKSVYSVQSGDVPKPLSLRTLLKRLKEQGTSNEDARKLAADYIEQRIVAANAKITLKRTFSLRVMLGMRTMLDFASVDPWHLASCHGPSQHCAYTRGATIIASKYFRAALHHGWCRQDWSAS